MQSKPLCWQNGQIIPAEMASVSVFDHGLLYGDGVFEGIRFYHNKAFMLDAHLDRLRRSAAAISLQIPLDDISLQQAIEDLIRRYADERGYLRLVVTRGRGSLGIDPGSCDKPNLFIIADGLSVVKRHDPEHGIKLQVVTTRRSPVSVLDPAIKSLNYLNNIIARIEANRAGADEALMLNLEGKVSEGSVDNVFIVKDQVLYTPPLQDGMLAGITRQVIMDLAKFNGIDVRERSLQVEDLLQADECFLCGTGAELIKVRQVNDCSLPGSDRPLLSDIERLFRAYIDQQCQA